MRTTTPMGELADLAERIRQEVSLLVQIVDGGDLPKDRLKARDAITTNLYTLVRMARYLDKPPSFSWHLVTEPLRWESGTYDHLPMLHRYSIHT